MRPTAKLLEDGHVEFSHDCLQGQRITCILNNSKDYGWSVVKENPLTVEPSVNCGDCGLHGFIGDPRAVSA